jgi:hypothetical protein
MSIPGGDLICVLVVVEHPDRQPQPRCLLSRDNEPVCGVFLYESMRETCQALVRKLVRGQESLPVLRCNLQ